MKLHADAVRDIRTAYNEEREEIGVAARVAARIGELFPEQGCAIRYGELYSPEGEPLTDDHAWVEVCGYILDPGIVLYRESFPQGWPGEDDIALIPLTHPLAECYVSAG